MRMRSLFSLTVSIVSRDADTAQLTRWPAGDTDSHQSALLLALQLGATSWTSITGISGVSFAEDAYLDKASSSEIAQEIDVYRGTASRAVMRKLGAVATACPWYTDPQTGRRATVSEQASPRFAEGGYVITVTDPAWRSGTTLVAARAGTAVVTVLSTDGADNGHASAMRLASQLVALLQGMT
jgi:hypothetical protein